MLVLEKCILNAIHVEQNMKAIKDSHYEILIFVANKVIQWTVTRAASL